MLSAAGTAGAVTPRERAQIQARASLDRALAIFHGQGTDPRGATGALLDLRMRLGSLSPAERRVARILLARPTDGHNGDWTAPNNARKHLCTTNFCIHWVTTTTDAPSLRDRNHNHKPDYVDNVKSVMTTVWNKEINNLGYRKPLKDGNSGSHHGGNPNQKIDIYLQDVGSQGLYGYCTSDDPRFSQQSNVSAYCVFDDNFSKNQFPGVHGVSALKVTAAHEFNHAIQFAYDVREDRWFLEATATNMEATVYPAIHDNYQYFSSSPLRSSNGANDGPWWPVDLFSPSRLNQYGTWIFFRFLCEWATNPSHPISTQPNCDIVRQFWEAVAVNPGTKTGGTYSTDAISDVLAGAPYLATFADVFREFGAANAHPADFYKDGNLYPTAGSVNGGLVDPGTFTYGQPEFHMANDYVRIRPDAGASNLSIDVDFPVSPATPRATVLVFGTGGLTETEIPLDADGDGSTGSMSFTEATVSKVVVVMTNAGTRFNCNKGTNFSCHGQPLDDSSSVDYNLTFNVS